jgi:predicted DNA-binding transcriptional regulator YafY
VALQYCRPRSVKRLPIQSMLISLRRANGRATMRWKMLARCARRVPGKVSYRQVKRKRLVMGKASTQDTLKYALELLSLIPHTPNKVDASTLKRVLCDRGYDKTGRTIQRTLKEMQLHFTALDCDETNKPFGWSWSSKAMPINVPAMSLDQAIVLTLAERVLPSALPGDVQRAISPYFSAAHGALKREVSIRKAAKWPKKVAFSSSTFALKPMQIDRNRMTTITQAIIEERWLEIRYRNANDEVSHSRVKPLGLMLEGARSYLVVQFEHFDNADDVARTLALSRIEMASVTDASFTYPANFSLDEFVASQPTGWGTDQQIRVKLAVLPYVGRILAETPLGEAQDVTRGDDHDDDWIVEATVFESERLVWWLLSFGAGVEVMEPVALRERIAGELRAAAQYYV